MEKTQTESRWKCAILAYKSIGSFRNFTREDNFAYDSYARFARFNQPAQKGIDHQPALSDIHQ